MQTVLIIVHLIIVLALIGVVLLQRSEGGGMGLGGGGGGGGVSGFMTGRGQANALTRTTAILAALFFVTSMALAIMATTNRGPRSILDGTSPTAPAGQQAPAGGGGNVLEQLQRLQGDQPAPAPAPAPGAPAPAVPAPAPAPAAPQVPQSQ
ncbi:MULTISPECIES: preprotein translocase subunit SecG [Microvirga]|uniref:preprotein translocase subunit SecG n=1 Tax=Microvirga TaxID=186650 RepID=UPI001CFFA628|nr:preprotein translocase subunit SecG [Microvirga lenta]MCB5176025.1 preprotein translocase subunit SecG [Microvirga lenta]